MKTKAFTLIETLIAITLMTVVITAVTGLILTTLQANARNLRSLQATLLAQEGLEALRYMRDSNWLQNYDWDGGDQLWGENFEAGTSGKTVYVVSTPCTRVLSEHPCFELSTNPDDAEVTLEGGMVFERSLELTTVAGSTEESAVTATVTWEERGADRSIQLSTYLTNWK
jgi:Tfp pilus assembly protein PilV